jgi:hypothetical protein
MRGLLFMTVPQGPEPRITGNVTRHVPTEKDSSETVPFLHRK